MKKGIKNIDDLKKRMKFIVEYQVHESPMEEKEVDDVYLNEAPEDEGETPVKPNPVPAADVKPATPSPVKKVVATEPEPIPAPNNDHKIDNIENIISQQLKKMHDISNSLDARLNDMNMKLAATQEKLESEIDEVKQPTLDKFYQTIQKKSGPFNMKISDFWDNELNDEQTPEKFEIDAANITPKTDREIQDSFNSTE